MRGERRAQVRNYLDICAVLISEKYKKQRLLEGKTTMSRRVFTHGENISNSYTSSYKISCKSGPLQCKLLLKKRKKKDKFDDPGMRYKKS